MIDEDTVGVIVNYGEPGPERVLQKVRQLGRVGRDDWRQIQPYVVNLYRFTILRASVKASRRLQKGFTFGAAVTTHKLGFPMTCLIRLI